MWILLMIFLGSPHSLPQPSHYPSRGIVNPASGEWIPLSSQPLRRY